MKILKISLIVLVAFLGILEFMSLLAVIFQPKIEIEESQPSSNEEIINEYPKYYYRDSCFLNQVAEAFINTNYEGLLGYQLHSRNPHHLIGTIFNDKATYQMLRCELCSELYTAPYILKKENVDKRFPKIREMMKKKYPDAFSCQYNIHYTNNIVFIEYSIVYNKSGKGVFFIYSKNIDNIKKLFPEYKIYDKCMPKENDCWIYNFEKNWYICSPNYNFCYCS